MRCRLIAHCAVYYDYDNSSILLSDNICTLSSIEFYLSSICITTYRKQPSKRIRLADYLSDNSMPHDIVVVHMVNNWYWTVLLGTVQMKPTAKWLAHGISHFWLCLRGPYDIFSCSHNNTFFTDLSWYLLMTF